jgi:hypothetical protein
MLRTKWRFTGAFFALALLGVSPAAAQGPYIPPQGHIEYPAGHQPSIAFPTDRPVREPQLVPIPHGPGHAQGHRYYRQPK